MLKQFVALQVYLTGRKKNKGQSLAEYGLILALIAVVCIAALTTLGNQIKAGLLSLAGSIGGAMAG